MDRVRKITIGCCWDGRDYYSPEYVNRLYRACARNASVPFDFVVYVGPEAEKPGRCAAIDRAIRIVPTGLPYWWCGMPWWMKAPPGVHTGSVLYLDLDVVVVGSLDDLILWPGEHAYMKDYPSHCCPAGLERDGNASAALIRNGAGARVWDEYVAAGMPAWNPLDPPPDRKLPLAVQSILNDPAQGIPFDVFPEEWVASYKLDVLPRGLPEDCRIVSFHGRPKPHETDWTWVKENWR